MNFFRTIIFSASVFSISKGYCLPGGDEDTINLPLKRMKTEYPNNNNENNDENPSLNSPAQLIAKDFNDLSLECKSLNESKEKFLQTMVQRLAVIYKTNIEFYDGEVDQLIGKLRLYNPSLYKDKFAENFVGQKHISAPVGSDQEKLLFKLASAGLVNTATLTDMFWDRHKQAYLNLSDGEKAAVQHMLAAQERGYFYTNQTQEDNIVNLCKDKVDQFINRRYGGYKFFGDKAWDQTIDGIVVVTKTQLNKSRTKGILESFFQTHNKVSLLLDLSGPINVDQLKIANVKNLIITNAAGDITEIPDNFLKFLKIKTIDMRGMTKVKTIGKRFMEFCTALTEISLNFPRLKKVDKRFMACCYELTEASLNFPELKTIGKWFMACCYELTEASLNFPSLREIGNYFMGDAALTETSLYFPLLEEVGGSFMGGAALKSASLYFPSLETIGNGFMNYCEVLKSASLYFPLLEEVGYSFMFWCKELHSIDWAKNLHAKNVDKRGFLEGTAIPEDDHKRAYKMITGRDLK